jgi:predicted nucleic acid-binding protein
MDTEIIEIIKKINSDTIMPSGWLKRNHFQYSLVCDVNNVICLYLSDNLYDFFLDRVKKELKKVNVDNEYIKLANELVALLAKKALHWCPD